MKLFKLASTVIFVSMIFNCFVADAQVVGLGSDALDRRILETLNIVNANSKVFCNRSSINSPPKTKETVANAKAIYYLERAAWFCSRFVKNSEHKCREIVADKSLLPSQSMLFKVCDQVQDNQSDCKQLVDHLEKTITSPIFVEHAKVEARSKLKTLTENPLIENVAELSILRGKSDEYDRYKQAKEKQLNEGANPETDKHGCYTKALIEAYGKFSVNELDRSLKKALPGVPNATR